MSFWFCFALDIVLSRVKFTSPHTVRGLRSNSFFLAKPLDWAVEAGPSSLVNVAKFTTLWKEDGLIELVPPSTWRWEVMRCTCSAFDQIKSSSECTFGVTGIGGTLRCWWLVAFAALRWAVFSVFVTGVELEDSADSRAGKPFGTCDSSGASAGMMYAEKSPATSRVLGPTV